MKYNKSDQSYGKPISELTDIKTLQNLVTGLWDLLDNIDTTSDIAKGNEIIYRQQVERIQRRRFDLVTSDGYDLFLPKEE